MGATQAKLMSDAIHRPGVEMRQLGLRVDPELLRGLHEAAEQRGLQLNWLCGKLLAEGLQALIPADEWRLTRERD